MELHTPLSVGCGRRKVGGTAYGASVSSRGELLKFFAAPIPRSAG